MYKTTFCKLANASLGIQLVTVVKNSILPITLRTDGIIMQLSVASSKHFALLTETAYPCVQASHSCRYSADHLRLTIKCICFTSGHKKP